MLGKKHFPRVNIYCYRRYSGIELIGAALALARAKVAVLMSFKVWTMVNRQTRSSRARRAATSSGSGFAPGGDEVKPSGKLQSPFSSFPPGAVFSSKIRFPRRTKLWDADRVDFFLAFDDPSVIQRSSCAR